MGAEWDAINTETAHQAARRQRQLFEYDVLTGEDWAFAGASSAMGRATTSAFSHTCCGRGSSCDRGPVGCGVRPGRRSSYASRPRDDGRDGALYSVPVGRAHGGALDRRQDLLVDVVDHRRLHVVVLLASVEFGHGELRLGAAIAVLRMVAEPVGEDGVSCGSTAPGLPT